MMNRFSFLVGIPLILAFVVLPESSGIDVSTMDVTVRPQDDLYRYMNGNWLKTFVIPADKPNYGVFTKLADEAERNLRVIIEESANQQIRTVGSDAQKVGDMYLSFMDSVMVEQLGIRPIQEDLAVIRRLRNKKDLMRRTAGFAIDGVGNPFDLFIKQDSKKTTEYALHFYQAGLSLPDRDYYLKDDPKFKEIRSKFLLHVEKMFSLAGMSGGAKKARLLMSMETEIARHHWTRTENRNRSKTYNKFSLNEFCAMTPAFDWKQFVAAVGMARIDSLVVYQPSYFKAFGNIFKKFSLEDWKVYYTWRTLSTWAPYLSSAFVAEDFQFFRKTLRGTEENRPRWKRAVSAVEGTVGELLGKIYVERHFKPEAKERMIQLVGNLKAAFGDRIKSLAWMSDPTKEKAVAKLAKFGSKIGYPNKWKDYSALVVKPDDLVGNIRRSQLVEFRREAAKLGKPIDREEWFMTPQRVNAYYSAEMNEVVFPAAILQPPFFNMDADDAVNYGAIGAVIGHEMTHGFDDQGRKSDGEGNLTDWWTKEDASEFEKRADVMIAQYDQFNPIDTLRVNGRLTLGENIADLGGMTIAYYAYKKSLAGKESPVIDGFTGVQRFFLAWAQVWAEKNRDDALRESLLTDPHSPGQYRVNGALANMTEFYGAYGVKPGDKLFRADSIRVQIW